MSGLTLVILGILVTTLVSILPSSFPALKNFPGKNTFIFRLFFESIALSVIVAALQNEKLAAQFMWLNIGAWVVGAILVFDCVQIAWAVWKYSQTPGTETESDADRLRTALLKAVGQEIQVRQRENFKNLEPQVVMPLQMLDMPEQVGRSSSVPAQPVPTVDSSWQQRVTVTVKRFLKLADRPAVEIPATRRLIEVFEQAHRRLLVLGKPGAGKTTLLLELAEQLLQEAQQPGQTQIPVRLECSSWKDERQSLADWMRVQLKDKYNVPLSVSLGWIQRQELIPLLDGLDELGLTRQKQATRGIADFVRTHHYPALVVCCRQEEFAQAEEPLFGLNGAVYLEPLNNQQIQGYLQAVQRPQLWEQIQTTDLRDLLPDWSQRDQVGQLPGLRSPLLLNMLLVAYQGQPIRSQSELFAAYIQEQFLQYRTKRGTPPYTETQTRRYLTWLARQLKAENTTEFEIENLQPNWLEHPGQRWLYRLIYGLIVGLIVGLIGGLIVGLIYGLIFGLIYGLIFGLIFGLDNISTSESFDFSPKGIQRGLIFGLIGGLIFGLIFGLIGGLIYGLICGLIYGLIVGLIVGLKNNNIRSKTQPNQGIWNTAQNAIFIGLMSAPGGVLLLTLPRFATGQTVEWEKWPIFALGGGLAFSMYAIQALLSHGTLRVLLWRSRVSPWNYAAFLAYASELRLVQTLGGRYRFVHDLLREHIIGQAPLPQRPQNIPNWIKYPGMGIGAIVAISAGIGTTPVSSRLAQVTAPKLQAGEWVFIDQYSYRFITPQRDELVSFRTKNYRGTQWIVGLPGDTISSRRGQLLVNGQPVDKPYTHFPPEFEIKKPFQVPAESYFVIGKKVQKDGTVIPTGVVIHRQQILGRYVWRLWPPQRFGALR